MTHRYCPIAGKPAIINQATLHRAYDICETCGQDLVGDHKHEVLDPVVTGMPVPGQTTFKAMRLEKITTRIFSYLICEQCQTRFAIFNIRTAEEGVIEDAIYPQAKMAYCPHCGAKEVNK